MKKTIIMATMAAMASVAGAVSLPFEVAAPSVSEIAGAKGDTEVAMYKMAASTSPWLVVDIANDDEFAPAPDLFWSNEVSRRHQSKKLLDNYAPVTGKKTGFVNISYASNGADRANFYSVWVPASAVTVAAPAPLTADNASANLALFSQGDLAGYGLWSTETASGNTNIYVGKVAGGMLVCPYVAADVPVSADMMKDGKLCPASFSEALVKSIIEQAVPVAEGQVFTVMQIAGEAPRGAFVKK